MITPDRGEQWGGYYIRDAIAPADVLFGIHWLNAFDCGSFLDDTGEQKGVSYVIFHADDFPDCKGRFAESYDVSLATADEVKEESVKGEVIKSDPIIIGGGKTKPELVLAAKISEMTFMAEVQLTKVDYLQKDKIAMSVRKEDVENKLDVVSPVLNHRFLGSTFEEVLDANPTIWQPITDKETEQEMPNIFKCSLEGE